MLKINLKFLEIIMEELKNLITDIEDEIIILGVTRINPGDLR